MRTYGPRPPLWFIVLLESVEVANVGVFGKQMRAMLNVLAEYAEDQTLETDYAWRYACGVTRLGVPYIPSLVRSESTRRPEVRDARLVRFKLRSEMLQLGFLLLMMLEAVKVGEGLVLVLLSRLGLCLWVEPRSSHRRACRVADCISTALALHQNKSILVRLVALPLLLLPLCTFCVLKVSHELVYACLQLSSSRSPRFEIRNPLFHSKYGLLLQNFASLRIRQMLQRFGKRTRIFEYNSSEMGLLLFFGLYVFSELSELLI
mmetsp:Transcript_6756/g.11615  ORF Transcript_6756/g.11615 Transcript_6756/m.11615 type:complete len:262 (+) Transcript_6756:727-1512(+)